MKAFRLRFFIYSVRIAHESIATLKISHFHNTCNKSFRFGYLCYVRKKIRQWKPKTSASISHQICIIEEAIKNKKERHWILLWLFLQMFESNKLTFIQSIWSKRNFILCISYSSFHQHHRVFLDFPFLLFIFLKMHNIIALCALCGIYKNLSLLW